MALITCPDCNTQVSDKANSCPNCGHPFKESQPTTVKVEQVQGTKKKYKRRMIWAALLGVIGFAMILNKSTINYGMAVFGVAVVYSIILKIQVWWSHD